MVAIYNDSERTTQSVASVLNLEPCDGCRGSDAKLGSPLQQCHSSDSILNNRISLTLGIERIQSIIEQFSTAVHVGLRIFLVKLRIA